MTRNLAELAPCQGLRGGRWRAISAGAIDTRAT